MLRCWYWTWVMFSRTLHLQHSSWRKTINCSELIWFQEVFHVYKKQRDANRRITHKTRSNKPTIANVLMMSNSYCTAGTWQRISHGQRELLFTHELKNNWVAGWSYWTSTFTYSWIIVQNHNQSQITRTHTCTIVAVLLVISHNMFFNTQCKNIFKRYVLNI